MVPFNSWKVQLHHTMYLLFEGLGAEAEGFQLIFSPCCTSIGQNIVHKSIRYESASGTPVNGLSGTPRLGRRVTELRELQANGLSGSPGLVFRGYVFFHKLQAGRFSGIPGLDFSVKGLLELEANGLSGTAGLGIRVNGLLELQGNELSGTLCLGLSVTDLLELQAKRFSVAAGLEFRVVVFSSFIGCFFLCFFV
jgi:hypothetical protein